MAISTDDFGIIMALLNENLAEGDLKGSGKETAVAEKVEEKKEEETAEQAKPAGKYCVLIFIQSYIRRKFIQVNSSKITV